MSLNIISTPIKERTETSEPSSYFMAHNPLYFEFQRQDYAVNFFVKSSSGTYNAKTIIYLYDNLGLVVGDAIYFKNEGLGISGTYEILYKNTIVIIIDLELSTGSTQYGGFINADSLKPNYYVKIKLTDFRNLTLNSDLTQGTEIAVHNVRPDADGTLKFDLSGMVKNLFEFKNENTYADNLEKDIYSSKKIGIYTQEIYTNSTTNYASQTELTVINGAKQIGDKYGASCNDYSFESMYDITEKAKFLTLYKPTYFEGYPFSISFINLGLFDFSEVIEDAVQQLILSIIEGGNETLTDLVAENSNAGYVCFINIDGIYTADKIFVKLKQDVNKVGDGYVDINYVDNGYTEEDGVIATTLGDHDLTESLQVNVNQNCIKNPLYLRWLNQLGGWNSWLFHGNYFEKNQVSESEIFEKSVEDISLVQGTIEYLKRNSNNRYLVGSETLTENDKRLVLSIARSRKVELYNLTDNTWLDVLVAPDTFDVFEFRESRTSIKLELMLSPLYLQ